MKTFSTNDILNRLKDALSISNDQELGKALGVTKGAISNWRKRNSIDYDRVFSICERISLDWLFTGEGDMFNDSTSEIESFSMPIDGIPLIPIEAMAGYFTGGVSVLDSDCERVRIPGLKADFVIPISGDSMEPKYYSGDYVACQRIDRIDAFFQWGKVYVIDTEQGILLKKVKKSKSPDHILLVSENPEYDPIELPKGELLHIALVKGLVRVV